MSNKVYMLIASIVLILTVSPVNAGLSYREKYADVLNRYSKCEGDSLKYRAALYLIDNMDGHTSPEGLPIDRYIQCVRTMRRTTGIHQLQVEWRNAVKEGPVANRPDSAVVSSKYLFDNIEAAFKSWDCSAWKDEITFEQFCRYILPYRVDDEHIGSEWRETLRLQYGTLITEITDMRRAFAVVKDSVFKAVVLSNDYCPYNLDPVTCNIIGRAECNQRCILLVAVLRALGIPSTIDGTPMWADYSYKGHAWVSMIAANGDTYTVYEKEEEAKLKNPIDASQFLPRYKIKQEDECPYSVKTEKTPVKVYRICYGHCNEVERGDPAILSIPFIQDVSTEYGLTTDIELDVDNDSNAVYLCSYLSGADWAPVAKSKPKNGKVIFRGVGKRAVCVPVSVNKGRKRYLSYPFLTGENGIEKMFVPSETDKGVVRINRKYPLCSYITDTWGYMRGGTFEAAMTEDFHDADTIAMITTMPHGMTTLAVSSRKKYRFLRYHAPLNNRSSLAELQFYTTDMTGNSHILKGRNMSIGVDSTNLNNVFDGNPATSCRGLEIGYTVGLDLGDGNETTVTKIVFSPSTDRNFVERNHLYELYCFDTEWRLLGRIYSKAESLEFDNVPKGALLLLKDKTGGKEERIFEYIDGRQIWY